MSARVAGVGVGTFIILLTVIVSILICLVGRGTPQRKGFILIGTLLTGIVVLILTMAPRETGDEEEKEPIVTTRIVAGKITVIVMMFLTLGASFVGWVLFHAADQIKAYPIDEDAS
eukprot:gb/GECG01004817.1/.p1 GENE.gb/GECG01004817.1/~~gb/GECG01004817.1/.p1  ORF type:complete len:116 (+),score=5.63 gb/GECG01004817.1/:1-348(+)